MKGDPMDQTERRRFLIRALLDEQPQYRGMDIPGSEDEQKRLLRSLFNIRMPADINSDFIRIQDEYLRQRNFENGIVYVQDIPAVSETGSTCPFSDKMSLWQGDITRLAADAIVNAANSQMLGCFVPMHTCIDNCIHTFTGIQLRAECSRRMEELRDIYGPDYEQPTAVPMLTEGYNLPAKKVIHIVGPITSWICVLRTDWALWLSAASRPASSGSRLSGLPGSQYRRSPGGSANTLEPT